MPLYSLIKTAFAMSLLAAPAAAQTGAPLDLEMRLDPATRETRFLGVVLGRGADAPVRIAPEAWIRPEVTGYAQAAAPIVVAMGQPAAPGLPITPGRPNFDGLPATPIPGDARTALVTDDLANSMLLNIADDLPGLTLTFAGGLANGPGPDLLIAEASLPAGRMSGACPGVPAPGADTVILSLPGGESLTLTPQAFDDFGPAGPQLNHGTRALGEAAFRIETIEQLRALEMRPLATIDYFKVYATAVDLADLGVAEGATVETVTLSSSGDMVDTDDGPRLCWTADPILVVGLPAG